MRIVCLGGGPAGLYFSILAKKANPSWDITVVERNRPDDTFGWGVVFSDKTMDGFKDVDPETHSEITRAFRHWDDIDVFFKGRKVTSGGHGFCGIGRIKLLQILQKRAAGLGAKLIFQTEITDPDSYAADYDLVIASDGGPPSPGASTKVFSSRTFSRARTASSGSAAKRNSTRLLSILRIRNGVGSICMRIVSMRIGPRSSSRRRRKIG